MSFEADYIKLRKKRLEEEKNKVKFVPKSVASNSPASLFSLEDPLIESHLSKYDENEEKALFKSGAFKDGYQAGDVLKSVGATAGDVITGVAQGTGNLFEGIADLLLYGVSGVSDLVGADSVADNIKELANVNVVDNAFEFGRGATGIKENSLLGGWGYNVPQVVGYINPVKSAGLVAKGLGMGTKGITALTSGMRFASSMGSGMSEAYQGGATDGEALAYGALSGTVEDLSERLFGGLGKEVKAIGLGKGLSSLDDMFAKKLSSKISNQFLKTATEYGIKSSAEGVEEVLAGIGSAVAKKLTYMSEEDLTKLVKDEKLLDQFVLGTVASGIMQSGDLVSSVKTGKDFITDLTATEERVVEKEFAKRIANEEVDGKKLSNKEKNKIYDQVLKEMDKGYISTDTIEEVLGGETYKAYKDAADNEKALKEEYDELRRMKKGEMNDIQQDRLAELKAMNLEGSTKSIQLKAKLDSEISKLVKDSRLAESYNEQARQSQRFEADLNQYSEKQRKIVQKAIDSGILNNTNRAHELVDLVAKVGADKGLDFDFADNAKLKESGFALDGVTVNGFLNDGSVTVNVSSAKALNSVVGHEIAHVLEGTELYFSLQSELKSYLGDAEYSKRLAAVKETYKNVYKGEDADLRFEQELTADLVGDLLFTDSDFVYKLSTQNRNVFQKLFDEIKYLCKVATAGTKEARQLEKIKKTFEDAYRESNKAQKNTATEDGVRYSIESDSQGYYVAVDVNQDIFDGKTTQEMQEIARKLIRDNFKGQVLAVGERGKAYVNKRSSDEYAYPANRRMDDDIKMSKMRAAPELDNLLSVSTFIKNQADDGRHPQATGGWDIYSTRFKVSSTMFGGEVKVMVTDRGYVFYDITQIKRLPVNGGQTEIDSVAASGNLSINSITDDIPSVNTNSMQEKQKNSLSSKNENFAPVKNGIYGKDVALQQKPLAPVREDIAKAETISKTENVQKPLGPVREDIKPTTSKTVSKDLAPVADKWKKKEQAKKPSEQEKVAEVEIENADKYVSSKDVFDRKIQSYQTSITANEQNKADSLKSFNEAIEKKQAEYDALSNKNTKKANNILQQIEKLKLRRDNIQAEYDRKISHARERLSALEGNYEKYATAEQRKNKQQEYSSLMERLVGDTSTWVDKKLGISYEVNTLRRNLRDIIRKVDGSRDIEKADAIYDELQGKYNLHEAELKRETTRIQQVFADMKITSAENAYVQMLGEFRHNPDTMLTEADVTEFYEKNKKNIDTKKVDKAINMARETYDSLLQRVNEVLREQGMKEIPYRQGYFPHFVEPKQNFIAKLLNWKTQNNDIPTDIAGLTENFKPNRSWQSFNKQRLSDTTDYNFLKGLDNYVRGALDWVYHIEDIQKRRAFENYIRYTHSDKGVQERVSAVYANEEYDADEAQEEIERILKEAKNPLDKFVEDFNTGTNILAGKKNSLDRAIEQKTNRHIYSVMTNVQNRISANMVLANVRSALTNFIPITQSWAQVSPMRSLQAAKDTIANTIKDDGTINKSAFLTNRLKEPDNLYQTTWDKVLDKAGIMFEIVDNFSSQVIWRSKYNQNLANGMAEAQAIKNADQFAENVMAGRSRGNEPTIFNAKNPLTKAFTIFQLEVNNQYGYLLKDVPNDLKAETEHWKFNLAKGYTTAFIGAYFYNVLLEKITGSDAALDPIGIIKELLRDLGLFDDDEEKEPAEVATNLAENVVEELPFVGGLFGGGRIPISAALPYSDDGLSGAVEDISEGNWENVGKELMNTVLNVGLPVGGGQLKKTVQGLKMFNTDEKHPVSGSYTDSGKLRFPVENTAGNKIQTAIFGQWASKNARDYFDKNWTPLSEEQVQEYVDVEMPYADYQAYRKGLKGLENLSEKADYIAGLDIPTDKKNILINNIADRKEPIDLTGYEDIGNFEEFDFSIKNPGKYAVSKAVGGYKTYKTYSEALGKIESDKDQNGDTISGSRKKKVLKYINSLDADYGEKIILYKSQYAGDDTYNYDIVDYLNSRSDISYAEMKTILEELGFKVLSDGSVRW